jgi:glutamine amidotransferase-like uncharacterized protein
MEVGRIEVCARGSLKLHPGASKGPLARGFFKANVE